MFVIKFLMNIYLDQYITTTETISDRTSEWNAIIYCLYTFYVDAVFTIHPLSSLTNNDVEKMFNRLEESVLVGPRTRAVDLYILKIM